MKENGDDKVRQAHAPDRQPKKSSDAPSGQGQFRGSGPTGNPHGHPDRETAEPESDDRERAEDDEEDAIHERSEVVRS